MDGARVECGGDRGEPALISITVLGLFIGKVPIKLFRSAKEELECSSRETVGVLNG